MRHDSCETTVNIIIDYYIEIKSMSSTSKIYNHPYHLSFLMSTTKNGNIFCPTFLQSKQSAFYEQVCVCLLSVYRSVYLSIYLTIHPSIHPSKQPVTQPFISQHIHTHTGAPSQP